MCTVQCSFWKECHTSSGCFTDHNEHTRLADVTTTADYSEEVKFALGDVYSQAIENLQLSKSKMQQQYNMNIRFNDYKPGEKVWLKTKYYKLGEHRKLPLKETDPGEF